MTVLCIVIRFLYIIPLKISNFVTEYLPEVLLFLLCDCILRVKILIV